MIERSERTVAPSPAVTVRVPASSANLGPGFDSFGLALACFDEVTVCPTDTARLAIRVHGCGAGQVPGDASHLVVRGVHRAWAAAGVGEPAAGLAVECVNRIPHGGGQGSSAAAIVAGLVAGRALLPDPGVLSDADLLELGNELEGHPDNVAPALLGGFTIAFADRAGRARAVRRDVHPDIGAAVFTAAAASSTRHSRTLLPMVVPHADAAANTAAGALLGHALTTDPRWLFEATADRLHQPFRAPAMPATASLLGDLRAAGNAAVVSGAGPAVLVLGIGPPPVESFARKGFRLDRIEVGGCGAQLISTAAAQRQVEQVSSPG